MLFPNEPDKRWFSAYNVNESVALVNITTTRPQRFAMKAVKSGIAPVADKEGVVVDERGRVVVSAMGEMWQPMPAMWNCCVTAIWEFRNTDDYRRKIYYADADKGKEVAPHIARTIYPASILATMSEAQGYVRATFEVPSPETAYFSITQPTNGTANREVYSTARAVDSIIVYNQSKVTKDQLLGDAEINFTRFRTAMRSAFGIGSVEIQPLTKYDDVNLFLDYEYRECDSHEVFPFEFFGIGTNPMANWVNAYKHYLLSCSTTIDQTLADNGQKKAVSASFTSQDVSGLSYFGFCFSPSFKLRVKWKATACKLVGYSGNIRGKNIKIIWRVHECSSDGLLTNDEHSEVRYSPVRIEEAIAEIVIFERTQSINQKELVFDVESEAVELQPHKIYAFSLKIEAEAISEIIDNVTGNSGSLKGSITRQDVCSVDFEYPQLAFGLAQIYDEQQTFSMRSVRPQQWLPAGVKRVKANEGETWEIN